MSSASPVIYDLVGLGFGPSNVAIAGALVEKWASPNTDAKTRAFQNVLFIEKHSSFQWHPGMLLPGAQMQISFMKDLATLRSPQSPITFLNYLHSQNRLASFINRGSTTPSRKEFADYLGWAARYVQNHGVNVNYGQKVVSIDEDTDGMIDVISKDVATNQLFTFKTRNLIISPGGTPRIPHCIAPLLNEPSVISSATVLHSSVYLTSVDRLFQSLTSSSEYSSRPLKIAIVGGGQSAAEVALNLRGRLSSVSVEEQVGHQIDMIISRGSIKPSDDTAFSNEVFDPETTEAWFGTSQQSRERMMAEYKPTNYSVVNPRTIENLYDVIYDQKVDDAIAARSSKKSKTARINIRPYMRIVSATSTSPSTPLKSPSFTLTLQNIRTHQIVHDSPYDAIICATGYQRTAWIDMFRQSKRLGKYFGVDSSTGSVKLVPIGKRADDHKDEEEVAEGLDESTPELERSISSRSASEGSGINTPLSSLGEAGEERDVNVYISRRYRLLSVSSAAAGKSDAVEGSGLGLELKARVYVQGMEEMTHGLSDTLLSVMGVRAGEVVEDLFCED